jgi:uncharacterized membrane protein YdjX (TVP38/TMEM64 family)
MDAFDTFVGNVVELIINPLIALFFALALAIFLWGAAQFILNADNEEARKKGKQHLIWGVIGFFIMVAVVGILRIVTATFGVDLPPR